MVDNSQVKARTLKIRRSLEFATRTETFNGEEYLVVPVVALVETVVFASNSEHPELVPAEAFSKSVAGWNGRPVFSGHPQDGESYVAGNTPKLLEEKQIGIVFNANIKDKKLLMEAWLNIERTKLIEPDLLDRVAAGDDGIEVSVGVFVETEDESGTFDGKDYDGVWKDLTQDHLAILPAGQKGACSVSAGCGIRAAKENEMSAEKNKQTFFGRALASFARVLQAPEDMTAGDISRKLGEALQKVDPRTYWPDDYNASKGEVYYSVYDGSGVQCYMRKYAVSENGEVTISGDPVEVERVTTYEVKGGGQTDESLRAAAEKRAAESGAPCSCKTNAPATEVTMALNTKKAALLAQVEAMTEEQAAAAKIETVVAPATTELAAAVPAATTETPAALTAKVEPVTFEALLAAAPADLRESIETQQRQLADRKATTIKALKESGRCDISDEKLKAMSQAELDQLVKLANLSAPRAAVDYSLQAPRTDLRAAEAVAPTPSLSERLRAAHQAGQSK